MAVGISELNGDVVSDAAIGGAIGPIELRTDLGGVYKEEVQLASDAWRGLSVVCWLLGFVSLDTDI
jgi:hypothetical protein